MATVINSLEKSISRSQKSKEIFRILLRSLVAGLVGYLIFLITLTVSYPILLKYFGLGTGHISGEDLIISTLGFLILYTTYVVKETKSYKVGRRS